MKLTKWFVYILLVIVSTVACWQLWAQPFRDPNVPTTVPKLPTKVGEYFFKSHRDYRLQIMNLTTIYDKTKRGVVSLLDNSFLDNKQLFLEYPTNQWNTVSNALFSMGKLNGEGLKPQYCLIQKDCIMESSSAHSDYEPSFLERRINAGDILIIVSGDF